MCPPIYLWQGWRQGPFIFLATRLPEVGRHVERKGISFAAVQVHEGMMQAATFVHTNAYEALQAAAERFPGWPVMLTGHSMGGKSSKSPQTLHLCRPCAGDLIRSTLEAGLFWCPAARKTSALSQDKR